jgi:hypothetical protein
MLKDYCKENIIPEKIEIYEGSISFNGGNTGNSIRNFEGKWKDGTDIGADLRMYDILENSFTISCKEGSKEGESINYLYCNNLKYSKTIQEMSKEGILGKKKENNYEVDLVLNPKGSWEFKNGFAMTTKIGENPEQELKEDGKYLGVGGYLQINGEVRVEEDNWFNEFKIYRNYSIINYRCKSI